MHEKKLWFNKYRNADYGTVMAGREPDDIQRNYGCGSDTVEKEMESADIKYLFERIAENEDDPGKAEQNIAIQ